MRQKVFTVLVLLGIIVGQAQGSPGRLSETRNYEPVIVKGVDIPQLYSKAVDRLFVYVYSSGSNSWTQVPYQIDERKWYDIAVGSNRKHPGTELLYLKAGEEGNGWDEDDELVFMAEDLGDKSDKNAPWINGADDKRYEIVVTDPLNGQKGYAYVYTSMTLKQNLSRDYVKYQLLEEEENSATTNTDYYSIHFARRWVMDELRLKSALGGNEQDVIDRMKFRVYGLVPVNGFNETEDYWSTGGRSWYLWDVDGPVRAIRMVQGAASGPTTTYHLLLYRKMAHWQLNMRVHSIPKLWMYIDYTPNSVPAKYFDANNSAVVLDGKNDALAGSQPSAWQQGSTPNGSIVFWLDVHDIPGQKSQYYYDEKSFNDQTGSDANAYGNHGIYITDSGDNDTEAGNVAHAKLFFLPPNAPNQGAEFNNNCANPLTIEAAEQNRSDVTSVRDGDTSSLPNEFELAQNHPNPFNAGTRIQFSLRQKSTVALEIFDSTGRIVRDLAVGEFVAGEHEFIWNGQDNNGQILPTGIYYYRLKANNEILMRRMVMLK